jgi:hypothetical protein
LIVDAVPILEDIGDSLQAVHDDENDELPNIVQVAAQAALLLIHKYSLLSADCKLYQIAKWAQTFALCQVSVHYCMRYSGPHMGFSFLS